MKVAVISTGTGIDRVHDASCMDVARDARKYARRGAPWVFEADTLEALALWSDIAGDTEQPGSEAHRDLCMDWITFETNVLPCCKLT